MSTSGGSAPFRPGRPPLAAGRRSSWRGRLIGAGLLLLPILELAVLIQVGGHIGVGRTLLLLLAGGVAGSLVLRQVGAAAIRRLTAASGRGPTAVPVPPAAGRPPAETALVIVAALLLIVPGFLSDVAALVLLLPPVRRALVRRVGETVLRRFPVRTVRVVQGQVIHGEPGGAPDPAATHVDVQIIEARRPGTPPPNLP
jgi:UPF0716 family protein affecting phage T7 exclusion